MKVYLLLTHLVIYSLFINSMDEAVLSTHRISPTNMIGAISDARIYNEFQLTLLPDKTTFLENEPPKQYGFLTLIPYIGHYGRGYPTRSRLALIQADPTRAINALPSNLEDALTQANLPDQAKYEYVIIVYGQKIAPQENIVLHPWVYTWQKKLYFTVSVNMGIFDPDGIKPLDLGLNNFSSLNVTPHRAREGGVALSPNNAKFQIYPLDREFSTAWFAAISPDKKHVMIAFLALANTKHAENTVKSVLEEYPPTLDKFLTLLSAKAKFTNENDQNALETATTAIKNIALGKLVPDKPKPDFTQDLELKQKLMLLNKTLVHIQNYFEKR